MTDDLTHYMEATARMRARAEAAELAFEDLKRISEAIIANGEREIEQLRADLDSCGLVLAEMNQRNQEQWLEIERLRVENEKLQATHQGAYSAGFEAGRGYPNATVIPDEG